MTREELLQILQDCSNLEDLESRREVATDAIEQYVKEHGEPTGDGDGKLIHDHEVGLAYRKALNSGL